MLPTGLINSVIGPVISTRLWPLVVDLRPLALLVPLVSAAVAVAVAVEGQLEGALKVTEA